MKQYISTSEEKTKKIARKLGEKIKTGVIALTGELGAGKTAFAAGFAEGLGIKEKIISPTFVIMRQHKIPGTNLFLYHIDLYRLQNSNDFKHLGLKDLLNNPKNLLLIEWAEKIEKYLPKETIKISIEKTGAKLRKITVLS